MLSKTADPLTPEATLDRTPLSDTKVEKTNENYDINNKNDNFVADERGRNQISESIPQGMERESDSIQRQKQGYQERLERNSRAAEAERTRPLDRYEKEDLERKTAFDYAKEKNQWVDDFHSLGETPLVGGNENTLTFNDKEGVVYKSNNLFNSRNSIAQFFENIEGHNAIFPDKYTFVGFTGMENKGRTPYIEPIVKQNFVHDVIQATQGEIENLMHTLGFEKVDTHTFKNEEYTVSDLRPRNVLKDPEGNIHVIDSIVSRNIRGI